MMEGERIMAKNIVITPSDTPWEIACMMINATYITENIFGLTRELPFFEKSDLRRIGEHLINYCNTEEKKKLSDEALMP